MVLQNDSDRKQNDAISELNGNISAHKTSADHDGRYYTEHEVNVLLAQHASLRTENTFSKQIRIENGGGVLANSYGDAQLLIEADTQNLPKARAQIGFHNKGINAGTLYLATDGTLCFCTNTGSYYTIQMTKKTNIDA